MGCPPFSGRRCRTNYQPASVHTPAPNPDPSRWELLEKIEYEHGYVLKVRYLDCTNFEGVKVMVYKGKYTKRPSLDPHFCDGPDAPIARFRPDTEGWLNARHLAMNLTSCWV